MFFVLDVRMGEETNSKTGHWVSQPVGVWADELLHRCVEWLRSMVTGRERSVEALRLGTLPGKQDSMHFVTRVTCLEVKRALGGLVVKSLLQSTPEV